MIPNRIRACFLREENHISPKVKTNPKKLKEPTTQIAYENLVIKSKSGSDAIHEKNNA